MVQKLARRAWRTSAGAAGHERGGAPPLCGQALVNQAYEDTSLPIGLGQTISKPNVVARMMELLRNGQPGKLGRVLEIGTGCGYQAAVLSLLASEVYSIERLRGLHDKARDNLRPFRLANVHLLFGDGMAGFRQGRTLCGHHCRGRRRGHSAALGGTAGGGRAAGGADGDGGGPAGAGGGGQDGAGVEADGAGGGSLRPPKIRHCLNGS
jgi:hypothetical protein